MKIKLAILDEDSNYLDKLSATFAQRYSDKIEFFLFTSHSEILKMLEEAEFDLLLLNKTLGVAAEEIPETCQYAYLSDAKSAEDGIAEICKFQRMDLLYEQIKQVLADESHKTWGTKKVFREGRLLLFFSVGSPKTFALAAACAMRLARKKRRSKVLYLDLEQLGGTDIFFSAQGQKSLTDVIRAMRDPDVDLAQYLPDTVRCDKSGVSFFAQAQDPMDMQELGAEGILRLITELKNTGDYDDIVLNVDFLLDRNMMSIYSMADALIMVGDHSCSSGLKAKKALSVLRLLGECDGNSHGDRIWRVCCNAEEKQGKGLIWSELPTLNEVDMCGQIGIREDLKERSVVEMLANKEFFDRLL